MQRIFYFFCTALFLTLFVGCGSGLVPLSGTVTFSDDGTPLTTGSIAFRQVGGGHEGRATIQPDGTYSATFGGERGLPPGTYQVVVFAQATIPIDEEAGIFNYEQLINRRYEDPATSGLSVTVNASTRTFDIQVDRFTGGRR